MSMQGYIGLELIIMSRNGYIGTLPSAVSDGVMVGWFFKILEQFDVVELVDDLSNLL